MQSKKHKIFNNDAQSDYVIVLREKKFPCWLLIFLLPLVLLLPISRNVNVQLVEGNNLPVDFTMTDCKTPLHWPYNEDDTLRLSDKTDSLGRVIFKDIKRPLWAVIFCKDTATVTAENGCHIGCYKDLLDNYPEDNYKIVTMAEKAATLLFIVADKETREPLPDADVTVWIKGEELHLKTDVAGSVEITAPVCAEIKITAVKEYFYPETKNGKFSDFIGKGNDDRTLYLRPKKGTVIIYIKDKKTRHPLPGATVYMNIAGGGQQQKVTTNVNGAALVSFADLRLTETIDFKSVKTNYADTILPPATVEKYITFDNERRTMYMRPLLKMLTFLNTDGVAPLSGVKNEIYINNELKYTVYSNSEGTFQVPDIFATDRISIVSSKTNYVTNSTKVKDKTIAELNTQESRTIPLSHNPPPPPPPENNTDLQGRNGKFRVNLKWNTVDDLDLHVFDPCGNEIYYKNDHRTGICNGHIGKLDVDANAGDTRTFTPQENIYWDDPSLGEYKIVVVYYSHKAAGPIVPINFVVTIIDGDLRREYRGVISLVSQQITVTRLTVR